MPTPTQTKPPTAAAVPTSSELPTLIAPEPTIELAVALPTNAGPSLAALCALDAALVKARPNFAPILKGSANPHFHSKYATLDTVLDAVMPALCDQGLSISSAIVESGDKWRVLTTLSHVGGGWRVSTFPIGDLAPQKVGSALTYGQRYGICALLSVAGEEDDDANAASTQGKAWAPKAEAAPAAAATPRNLF